MVLKLTSGQTSGMVAKGYSGPKLNLPLSDHLVRVFKTSEGRPDGLVQYHFYSEPDMARPIKVDRHTKVATYLDKHATCW